MKLKPLKKEKILVKVVAQLKLQQWDQLGSKECAIYVPGLNKNRLSVELEREGFNIPFQNDQVLIRDIKGTLSSIGVSPKNQMSCTEPVQL
jgi:hypothetical protein